MARSKITVCLSWRRFLGPPHVNSWAVPLNKYTLYLRFQSIVHAFMMLRVALHSSVIVHTPCTIVLCTGLVLCTLIWASLCIDMLTVVHVPLGPFIIFVVKVTLFIPIFLYYYVYIMYSFLSYYAATLCMKTIYVLKTGFTLQIMHSRLYFMPLLLYYMYCSVYILYSFLSF